MIEPDENGEASPNNPRPDPLDLPLVELADASQAETLARALREKTLVVEGPPGTGKSQTITNLIAAGLYEGQTVLFVAEKLAALEVVRRKLMQSSLADFTLELHSHKTQKALVFRDLERRLVLQPESVRGDDAELLYRRAAAELDQAAAELGHPANELGDTRSDVFRDAGVANRWLQAFCPRLLEAEDAELPTDPSRRHQLANALQDLSENLVSMQGEGHSPADHPWRIVDPERAAPINAVARLQRLKALAEALRDLSSQAAALDFELDEGDRSSGALVEAGLDAAELERLIGVWNALSEIVARADQAWRRAKPALERIAQAISRAGVESATDLDILAAVLNLAESAPVDFDPAWPERLLSRDAGEKVEALRAELSDLRQRREELRRIFRDASLETATATEARESADVLERMGFFAFLSRAGRAARRYFAERAAPGVRLNRAARVKALRRLSEFAELRSRLLATEVYTQCFGSLFRGDRTDIDAIMRMRNWLLTAREKLSEPAADGVPLWRKLARSDPSVLTDLIDLGRDNVRDGQRRPSERRRSCAKSIPSTQSRCPRTLRLRMRCARYGSPAPPASEPGA